MNFVRMICFYRVAEMFVSFTVFLVGGRTAEGNLIMRNFSNI